MIAIGQSILGMVYRSSRVDVEVLGKIPGVKAAWGGVRQHPERTTIPGILVLRANVSLFWVNAAEVQEAILQAVDAAPDTVALILNLESTDQLETTSADMLSELREQLAERNVDLYLVRVRWRVRTVLAHSGLRVRLGEDHLWHNVAQGIREARRQHGIDRPGGAGTRAGHGRRGGRDHRDANVRRRAVERNASPPTLRSSGWPGFELAIL